MELITSTGVRLRCFGGSGPNWLLVPGGPGLGSQCLYELAALIEPFATVWLVDMPGDGDNAQPDPYHEWKWTLLEAVQTLSPCVAIGHSTGGHHILRSAALAPHLAGVVLMSTSSDGSWRPDFEAYCEAHPLPAIAKARDLREVCIASVPWNCEPQGRTSLIEIFKRCPINPAVVEWYDTEIDPQYKAAWFPVRVPVLILAGDSDHIVTQHTWDRAEFAAANVTRIAVPSAGHWPWLDNPVDTLKALETMRSR